MTSAMLSRRGQSSQGLLHMAAAGGKEQAGAVGGEAWGGVPFADARGGEGLSLSQSA